jgi:hypothetical protein
MRRWRFGVKILAILWGNRTMSLPMRVAGTKGVLRGFFRGGWRRL